MQKKIYETDRLYAREMTAEDLPALSAFLQDAVAMHAYEHAFSDEEVQSWLDKNQERYRKDGFGLWALVLKETGEMIGDCGISWQEVRGESVLEVGYHLNRDFWHNGYAIEAASAAKEYAFEALDAKEVFTIVRDTNIASMNVAIRNGMAIRDRFVKHYYGIDMPHYVFSEKRN